jgi:hypothetical protein
MNVSYTQKPIKNIVSVRPGIYNEIGIFDVDQESHKLVAFGSTLPSIEENFIRTYKSSGIFMLKNYCSDNTYAYRLSGIVMEDSKGDPNKELLKHDKNTDSIMNHTLRYFKTALVNCKAKLPTHSYLYGTTKTPYEIVGEDFLLPHLKPMLFDRIESHYGEFMVDTTVEGLGAIFKELQPIDHSLTMKKATYGRLVSSPVEIMDKQWFAATFHAQHQIEAFTDFIKRI